MHRAVASWRGCPRVFRHRHHHDLAFVAAVIRMNLVTVLGTGWGAWRWFTASWGVTDLGRTVVEGILILGLGMLVLATATGMTAALLQQHSRLDPETGRAL